MSAVLNAATDVAVRIRQALTPRRVLAVAWLVGLVVVGSAHNAAAAEGGLYVSPDLGDQGGQTLFERFPVSAYDYPVDTDSDHDGLESQVWNVANAVAGFLTWLGLSILRGALVALQWLLNLDLYDDQAESVDRAMASLSTSVFLPLLGVTVVVGAAIAYTRNTRSGGGTMIADLTWLVAGAVLAVTFVAQPSQLLTPLNEARSALASAMATAYSDAAGPADSATGYPTPDTGNDTGGAIRQLTDSLWNVYGVNGWCYTAWESTDACASVGLQYLEDPDAEDGTWGEARAELEDDGDVEPFASSTGWVRGQESGRIGSALLMALVSGGAGLALLVLVVFGLMAAIGLILLAFLGVLFLALWVIPGRPRAMGVRWLEALFGAFLQSLIITTIAGAVMVVGSLFNAATPTYGIFMVAVFNLSALVLGLRYRGQFEQFLGFGDGATGRSVVSQYLAARTLTSAARLGRRGAVGGTKAAVTGGRAVGGGAVRAGRSAGQGIRAQAARMPALRRGAVGQQPADAATRTAETMDRIRTREAAQTAPAGPRRAPAPPLPASPSARAPRMAAPPSRPPAANPAPSLPSRAAQPARPAPTGPSPAAPPSAAPAGAPPRMAVTGRPAAKPTPPQAPATPPPAARPRQYRMAPPRPAAPARRNT